MPSITLQFQLNGGLGGGSEGISPSPVENSANDSEHSTSRTILRRAWNGLQASQNVAGGRSRVITPFRAVNNAGDYLARTNYVCGGSNQVNNFRPGYKSLSGGIRSSCDGTNIAASVTNNKFVYDSSDYITYRKLRAIGNNYNDLTH